MYRHHVNTPRIEIAVIIRAPEKMRRSMLGELWKALTGHGVRPPQPNDLIVALPEFDEPEEGDGDDGDPGYEAESITGYACIIRYRNQKEEVSERRVTCHRLVLAGGTLYLKAHCHERRARRTFRIDRILQVIDLHTGEIFDDSGEFFREFDPDETRASGLNWGLHVRRRADLVAGLNALVFMGRCDEEWHPLEREVLERFVAGFWLHHEINDEPPLSSIIAHAERLVPDAEAFFVALLRVEQSAYLKRSLQRHLQAIVDADGIIRPQETHWGAAVDRFFKDLIN